MDGPYSKHIVGLFLVPGIFPIVFMVENDRKKCLALITKPQYVFIIGPIHIDYPVYIYSR